MKLLLISIISSFLFVNDSYKLSLNLQEGDVYKYLITYQSNSIADGGPIPLNTELVQEYEFTISVLSKKNSAVKINAKCEWEKMNIDLSGHVITVDSRSHTTNKLFPTNKAGKSIQFSMLHDGKVSDLVKAKVKGKNGEVESDLDFGRFFDIVSGAYPLKPVKAGDSWKDSTLAVSTINHYYVNKYTLEKIDQGFAYISVLGKISTKEIKSTDMRHKESPWGGGMMSEDNKGNQKGLLIFNIKNGGLVNAELSQEVISESSFVPHETSEITPPEKIVFYRKNSVKIELISW